MLWGRSTCMHSGILRSAFQTPFQEMGCGGFQRKSLTGGCANGTPSHALTPDGTTLPATMPSSVRIGATGVSTTWVKTGATSSVVPRISTEKAKPLGVSGLPLNCMVVPSDPGLRRTGGAALAGGKQSITERSGCTSVKGNITVTEDPVKECIAGVPCTI
jgi:hypothetical protein